MFLFLSYKKYQGIFIIPLGLREKAKLLFMLLALVLEKKTTSLKCLSLKIYTC